MDPEHPLHKKLEGLPESPGVYLMKDEHGRVLYVGKASRLAVRVRSYFAPESALDQKTTSLVRKIADFDYVVTANEREALLLEDQLIKEFKPRYNIRLKDDKRYPWLRLSVTEAFPRLSVVRKPKDDGQEYYGPYTNAKAMRQTLKTIGQVFRIRTCQLRLPEETVPRPCLDYHIKRCDAPCVNYIDRESYGLLVEQVRLFLSGQSRGLLDTLQARMNEASQGLRFEEAARLRDQIEAVRRLDSKQEVVWDAGRDVDAFGLDREGRQACGVVLRVRDGKLLHSEAYFFSSPRVSEVDEFFQRFTSSVFSSQRHGGSEVMLMSEIPQMEHWEEVLGERLGRRVRIKVARRGKAKRLVDMARANARWKLRERLGSTTVVRREVPSVLDLKERLSLPVAPWSIECFDMSHIQGSQRVGSLVYFQAGEPLKSRYRRFRIQQSEGIDDFGMMQEVLERYYSRLRDEDKLPADLVVVDGGAGQLSVAVSTLSRYGFVETAVVGLAKKHEEIYLPNRREPVRLPKSSSALKLLQRARDEAHRFAVSYHRNLRGKELKKSVLDEIPGIGAKKKRALLLRFGSVDAVAKAAAADLVELEGIGRGDAERILAFFSRRKS